MKKTLLILGAVFAAGFLLITYQKRSAIQRADALAGPSEAEAARVREFWGAYNLGMAERAQGRYPEAAAAFRHALQLNPAHEDSLYYLGTSLYELGDYHASAEVFRKIVAANPQSGRGWSQLGNALSIVAPGAPADFNAAEEAYRHAEEVNREQSGPFLRLGALDLNRGRLEPALQNFQIAARFGSPEGSVASAYTLLLLHREREAAPYLKQVLAAYGRDKKITGKGVLSEGDIIPASGKPLTPLEKVSLRSILLMYWASARLGGYPAGVANEFHVSARQFAAPPFAGVGGVPAAGRGVAADFSGNGRADLVTSGTTLALYRPSASGWTNVTRAAGLESVGNAWDAVAADYDHDGHPDLYVLRSGYVGRGQNALYHNKGNGTFADVTAREGLEGVRSTAHACFADFAGSGRLDLIEVGAADANHSSVRFYRNTPSGFLDQTRESGLASDVTATDCVVADYDHDGKPDVLVLFWKKPAALFHNDGGGRFSNVTERAGLANTGGTSYSALFFDYDRDGWPDLLVTTQAPYEEAIQCLLQPAFRATQNTPRLFHNRHDGTFEDVTARLGLERAYGTLQAIAADFDGDGWPDVLLVNGSLDAERLEPSVVLHNLGGKEFREWFSLPASAAPANALGAVVADLDGDGRPDIYFAENPLLRSLLPRNALLANRLVTEAPRSAKIR